MGFEPMRGLLPYRDFQSRLFGPLQHLSRNPCSSRVRLDPMAERVGFEPTSRCNREPPFRERRHKPLGHLSFRNCIIAQRATDQDIEFGNIFPPAVDCYGLRLATVQPLRFALPFDIDSPLSTVLLCEQNVDLSRTFSIEGSRCSCSTTGVRLPFSYWCKKWIVGGR